MVAGITSKLQGKCMKINSKSVLLAVLIGLIVPAIFGMEKPMNSLNLEDVKGKYLMIIGSAGIPSWIRVKNTDGQVYVETMERKEPITSHVGSDIQDLYKNSGFQDRILVSRNEPVLIPYDEIKAPLRVRIWTFDNKDKDDNAAALAFLVSQKEIEALKAVNGKLTILASPDGKIKFSAAEAIGSMDSQQLKNGQAKILTLEAQIR